MGRLSKQFSSMPIEEFFAMLLKSMAGEASTVGGGSAVKKGRESNFTLIAQRSEVVAESPIDEVPEAPLKERKRHWDGHSSRSHHTKKLKEPMSCSGKNELPSSVMSGEDARVRSSM